MPMPFHVQWNDGLKARVHDRDKAHVHLEHRCDNGLNHYFFNLARALNLRLEKIYLFDLSPCSKFLKGINFFPKLNEDWTGLAKTPLVGLNELSSPSLQTISFKAATCIRLLHSNSRCRT